MDKLSSNVYQINLKLRNFKSGPYEIPFYEDSKILPDQIPKSNIERLEITNCNINLLPEEVYTLKNIIDIKVSDNNLTVINLTDLVKNNKLNKINASNNIITELNKNSINELTNNNHIESIDLSHNSISEIPDNYFEYFKTLLHLNLSYNHIKNFNFRTFEGISALQTLQVSNNELYQIEHTLMRFNDLLELTLDNNNIKILIESNFQVMSKLEKLNLSSNAIQEIEETTFQNLSELRVLDLSNNQISFLSNSYFKNNNKLQTVYLSQNLLTTIAPEIFKGKLIEHFRVKDNNISNIIDSTTFNGICEQNLDLSNNKLLRVKTITLDTCKFPLESLNLSRNCIYNISQDAFKSFDALLVLDLSYNKLSDVDFNISHFHKLEYLNISHNEIKKISKFIFRALTSLKTLDFSQNIITEIEEHSFDDLSMLETLYLNNNVITIGLSSYVFQKLVALTQLDITYTRSNTYENNTFSGMSSLKVLNSSHGELSILAYGAFQNTGSLEVLDLSHNILEYFIIDTTSIISVNKLYLNNNKIRTISKQTFYNMVNIDTLFLQNNNIMNLHPSSFNVLTKLLHVNLENNKELILNGAVFDNLPSLNDISLKNVKRSFNFQNSKNTSVANLDVSFCDIIDINLLFIYNTKNILNLNLRSNKIRFIDKHSFQSMPYLTNLDLSFNLITNIQPGSFLKTKMIRSLNLHGNDISLLQYGVFDGLENMIELNLSSNFLHSFELNVLHSSPVVSVISLNDNVIEKINFDDFINTNVKKLLIGGNIIPCNDLIKLKTNDYLLDNLTVTSEILDYHSENVNGITCRTEQRKNKHPTLDNSVLGNVTTAFDYLSNAMEMFRNTIENFAKRNDVDQNETKKSMENVLSSINKLIKVYNESQTVTNIYLKQLIEKNSSQIQYYSTSVQDHVKSDKDKFVSSDIPIYVTLACLVVLLGLGAFFMYNYYKWRNSLSRDNHLPSTQRLTSSAIELT
ncbi:toll-like receptor 7 [Achroia grisella]|uniref:toll-like receptor 7 n=1 Tax=Achroia grisella TaxID=688607 RepID=UPI0027D32A01|nr:toll-like receptor 7 [Achroia grisella]